MARNFGSGPFPLCHTGVPLTEVLKPDWYAHEPKKFTVGGFAASLKTPALDFCNENRLSTRARAPKPRYSGEMRPSAQTLIFAASLGIAFFNTRPAAAQKISAKDQKALIASARAQYYNLRAAGVKSFHCDIEIDWMDVFTNINGKSPLPDDPMIRYLTSTRLSIQDDLAAKPNVEWAATGAPPEGLEKRGDQLRDGFTKMIGGFFTAWSPALNGTLIPVDPTEFEKTPTGYAITNTAGTATDHLVLDDQMKLTHMSSTTDTVVGEMDMTFAPTKKGLVQTEMVSVTRLPPSAPPVASTMSATFEPVDDFLLPATLKLVVSNVLSIKMQFDHCTVQRLKP